MAEIASDARWTPRSAWAGVLPAGAFGAPGVPGLVVAPREGLGMASLMAASGGEAALAAAVRETMDWDLPDGPGFARGRTGLLVWSGPGHWLAVFDRREDWAGARPALAAAAAISEQSDARGVLRLSGPRVRDVLAKGIAVDLHPSVFGPGDAAATLVAHVGIQLWQRDDAPTYELAVPRSQAGTIWSWLQTSAAEYGGVCEG